MAAQLKTLYQTILQDERVRAVMHRFPSTPFVAVVVGTGAENGACSFLLVPLWGFIPGIGPAASLASFVQSAVRGNPVPASGILDIIKGLGTTALGLPNVVVGTMTDGDVKILELTKDEVEEDYDPEARFLEKYGTVVDLDVEANVVIIPPQSGEDSSPPRAKL